MGGVFELYLEAVALHLDGVEVEGLQDLAGIADEAGGAVVDLDAEHGADVDGGAVGHQDAPHRPVDDVDAVAIAGADGHVGAALRAGFQQAGEVLRIVGEVGIHLEDIVIVALQRPAESGHVGRSKAELAAPFDQVQPLRELLLQVLDRSGGAVRRAVVDDQDVIAAFQVEDGPDDLGDVLDLVVGRDDDEFTFHDLQIYVKSGKLVYHLSAKMIQSGAW